MSPSSHFPSAPDHVFKTPLVGQGWLLHSGATSPNRNQSILAEGLLHCVSSCDGGARRCVCFSWVQDPHGETSGKVEKLGFSGGSDFNPGLSTFPRRETMERLPKPWSFGFLIS